MALNISRGPLALRNARVTTPEIAREEIGQVRAQIELPFLRQLKGPHHRFRILREIGPALRKELPVANAEIVRRCSSRVFSRGRKLKSERVVLEERPLANCSVIRSVTRKIFRVCS